MKFIPIFIFNLLMFLEASGQKEVSRIYDTGNIEHLEIYADEVYKIKITTTRSERLKIISVSEGEYYNDISVDVEMLQDRFILSSSFPKNLQGGYDKLSAHKVFSVELILEVPEGLRVYVESNIAAVTASGNYKSLQVQLRSGFCRLENFEGNALVNTYSGSIDVFTKNSTIEAFTRTGSLSLPPEIHGKNLIKLQSNTGNITVREN